MENFIADDDAQQQDAAAPEDLGELHAKLKRWFQEADDATDTAQRNSAVCRDYYDGNQWTAEEIETLKRRGQPVIVDNRIKPKVDFLLGMESQQRTEPRCFPRAPRKDQEADAATDAIRYVLDQQDFSALRSDVFEALLIEGTGGCEVTVSPVGEEINVELSFVPFDRLFWDPHSRRRDFSDAKYVGITAWMDREDALARWPGKGDIIEATLTLGGNNQTFDDVPRNRWVDAQRQRCQVIAIYWRESGGWQMAYLTREGFLVDPAPSPYLDEDQQPVCPLEMQSAFVDRDGARYGLVKQFIDMQDEVNKRRSKALFLLTARQTVGERGAVDDIAAAKRELSKPDGHVEKNPNMAFDVLPTADLAAGQFELLGEAKSAIDNMGPNPNMMGKAKGKQSGRAVQAIQQAGAMEVGPLFRDLRAWQRRVYRQIWQRIRQYWTAEKWVRVTDDERNLKWVGLNVKVTLAQKLQEAGQQIPPQLAQDPRLQEVVEVRNNPANMDMDIILSESPDLVTAQQEQFEQLTQIYPSIPPQMQGIAFEMLIEASSLRNKQQILDRLKGLQDPQQAQQQAQKAAEQEELAKRQAHAEVAEQEAKARQANAKVLQMEAEASQAVMETEMVLEGGMVQ